PHRIHGRSVPSAVPATALGPVVPLREPGWVTAVRLGRPGVDAGAVVLVIPRPPRAVVSDRRPRRPVQWSGRERVRMGPAALSLFECADGRQAHLGAFGGHFLGQAGGSAKSPQLASQRLRLRLAGYGMVGGVTARPGARRNPAHRSWRVLRLQYM